MKEHVFIDWWILQIRSTQPSVPNSVYIHIVFLPLRYITTPEPSSTLIKMPPPPELSLLFMFFSFWLCYYYLAISWDGNSCLNMKIFVPPLLIVLMQEYPKWLWSDLVLLCQCFSLMLQHQLVFKVTEAGL